MCCLRATIAATEDEAGVEVKTSDTDVFFDGDGKAMERTDGATMLGEIFVEVGCSRKGAAGKELCDTIYLFKLVVLTRN